MMRCRIIRDKNINRSGCERTLSWPTLRSCWMIKGHLYSGMKWSEREADHSLPSNADDKNAWSFTSTYLHVFLAWSLSLWARTVFWVVAPCSLVQVYWRFGGACCLHGPDDAGYTAQHPRGQSSSYWPPWEPKTSVTNTFTSSTLFP
jgi:hypothetical protein